MKFTDLLGDNKKAWLLCIANSSQFGNNAHCTLCKVNDGLLDIVLVKRAIYNADDTFAVKMFNGKLGS